MASEVDICNLALGHLGDRATVASLDPPEGSAQAEHCARFYPIARDTLLEMHAWRFATRRATLTELSDPPDQWTYSYARPSDCLKVLAVLAVDAPDDLLGYSRSTESTMLPPSGFAPAPQDFTCEINDDLAQIILTNQEAAQARYIARVTDTTTFPALFTMTLSWQLASLLAGPVLKGDVGAAESKRCTALAMQWAAKAMAADATQRKVEPLHVPAWIGSR